MDLHQLRIAGRSLWQRQQRAYSLAAVLTLALGIGASAAIMSIVHAVLLAPLPYPQQERVLFLSQRNLSEGLPQFSVSIPDFLSWREQLRSFEHLAAVDFASANVGGDAGPAERVPALRASASLWAVLGQPLLLGRPFTAAEDHAPGAAVAILGENLWRTRYGADPQVVGRSVRINGTAHSIVGVAAADAGFATDTGVWLPLAPDPSIYSRGDRRLDVLGRLAPGVSLEHAQAELAAVSARLAAQFPAENCGWEGMALPVRDWIVGPAVRERLLILACAVALLLLVACTNVANLQIARASARARELGVRQALGAGRGHLLGQLGSESLLLTLAGATLGVLLAGGLVAAASALLPPATPRLALYALDWRSALLATLVAGGATIAFALLPLWRATRCELTQALRLGGRSPADGIGTPLRQGLVVLQFALATVLVLIAALLARHFLALQDAALGFRPEQLLTARITMPQLDESEDLTADYATYARLLERIAALPGVEASGMASEIPLGEMNTSMRIASGSGPLPAGDPAAVTAAWRIVSPGYLDAIGVPLLRGRHFSAENESPRNLLVSAELARRLWPDGSDPVGRSIRLGNQQQRTVIGVVGDARQLALGEEPGPTMYMATSWALLPTMNLVLRTTLAPAALAQPLRELAREVAPDYPLFDVRPMTAVVSGSVAEPRLQTLVLLGFAAASLLLAALGVAGVMAWMVTRRSADLALRLALGAAPGRLLRYLLGRGAVLCLAGMLLGAVLLVPVLALARSTLGLQDGGAPTAFAAAAAILAAIGLLACWLPARRVLRISPRLALAGE